MGDAREILTPPMKYVEKGWGSETWVVNRSYCGKILYFIKGKKCSWHHHFEKSEVFMILRGKLKLKYSWDDDITKAEETILHPGMNFDIPVGLRHQIIALEESYLLEVSSHHSDSDSIRIQKGD